MNRIFTGTLLAFLAFIAFGVGIFKFGLGNVVYNLFSDNKDVCISRFQFLNLFGISIFMILFSIFGFFLSKKKGRNRFKWSLLCFFFNFWAFIILWFLPTLNNNVEQHKKIKG